MNKKSKMTIQQAQAEAERCLQCFDAPCIHACPTHIDIPTFVSMIKSSNIRGAAEVVRSSNALANICGKVCPEEIYCQPVCNRAKEDAPIHIRELHFFVTQYEARRGYGKLLSFQNKKKRVAVIGGGPSGLGCAFELTKLGYTVTIFDKNGLGGIPKSSIPSFRLGDNELHDDVNFLSPYFNVKKEHISSTTFSRIKMKFAATYISVGLGRDRKLGIPGENLCGVFPVLGFLERAKTQSKKFYVGKNVVVIGGGNVSLDAAATAKRCGASTVTLVYRRSERQMKVWQSELQEARNQGVHILFLTKPLEIVGKQRVRSITCMRTKLSSTKDNSGRPMPVDIEGSDFVLEADTVLIAVGQVISAEFIQCLKRNAKGYIAVDKHFRTSENGVFAGGDAISGEGTIVQSVAHGKEAAREIHKYLS